MNEYVGPRNGYLTIWRSSFIQKNNKNPHISEASLDLPKLNFGKRISDSDSAYRNWGETVLITMWRLKNADWLTLRNRLCNSKLFCATLTGRPNKERYTFKTKNFAWFPAIRIFALGGDQAKFLLSRVPSFAPPYCIQPYTSFLQYAKNSKTCIRNFTRLFCGLIIFNSIHFKLPRDQLGINCATIKKRAGNYPAFIPFVWICFDERRSAIVFYGPFRQSRTTIVGSFRRELKC
jgi:hypothetical protein